jgi:hypothetical protein
MAMTPQFLPIYPYTRDAFVPQKRLDPINLVFAGSIATIDKVRSIVMSELGCWTDKMVSDQYFQEPLAPVLGHRQDLNQTDALASGFWGRLHTRTYQAFTADQRLGGRFIASPIHIDKWTTCGDAADTFDLARDRAVAKLRPLGYDATLVRLATPDAIAQCDGRLTPWDGQTAVVVKLGEIGIVNMSLSP